MIMDVPLNGLKVVDLTNIIMGPFTTQILGDLGAEIIKIETPEGDLTRDIGVGHSKKMTSVFLGVNRNKKSLVLNLKEKKSKEDATLPKKTRGRLNDKVEANLGLSFDRHKR